MKNLVSKYSRNFNKEDTIRYYMLAYCSTKWLIREPECDAYWDNNCHTAKVLTEKCKEIGIKEYSSTYEGRACKKSFWSTMTVVNRDAEDLDYKGLGYNLLRPILNYATVLIMFGLLIWKSHKNEIDNIKWDSKYTTGTDFSVLLNGLPNITKHDRFEGSNIKDILAKKLKDEGYEVTQMCFIYNTEKFLELKQDYTVKMTELAKKRFKEEEAKKKKKEGKKEVELTDLANTEDEEKNTKTHKLLKKAEDDVEELKHELLWERLSFHDSFGEGMIGSVFVSFKTAHKAQEFMTYYKRRGFLYNILGCCGFQNQPFVVTIPARVRENGEYVTRNEEFNLFAEMPPEPGDVIWENLAYKPYEIFWRKGWVIFVSFLVFLIGFSLLILLNLWTVSFAFFLFFKIFKFFSFINFFAFLPLSISLILLVQLGGDKGSKYKKIQRFHLLCAYRDESQLMGDRHH